MQKKFSIVIAIILIIYPLLHIPAVWKNWLAFSLGVLYLICVIVQRVRSDEWKSDTYEDKS